MLSYEEALVKVEEQAGRLRTRRVGLREALGLVLARDLFSPEALPAFDQSAVDGYAVSFPLPQRPYAGTAIRPPDWRSGGQLPSNGEARLKVRAEIRAGDWPRARLKPGEAARIFTGAPIPPGTHAVVMQEQVEGEGEWVTIARKPDYGENIRRKGEDVRKGSLLVRGGTVLEAAPLALLAQVGFKRIPVFPPPRVAILATGSELVRSGERRKPGKIRDSNTILLESLVRRCGGVPTCLEAVGDEPEKIRGRIRKGLGFDFFLISGGVSVGKYDFVKEVLAQEGVREIFWKVDIKPGKPLWFGKKRRTLVFGLPGNPVSVFVTFEEFVKPALLKACGMKGTREIWTEARLTRSFRNGSKLHFVRVRSHENGKGLAVTPLKGQGSHMLGSLAQANATWRVPPNAGFRQGEKVRIKLNVTPTAITDIPLGMPVLSVVGRKGSGRSEIVAQLVSILAGRGYRVGVVKHLARDEVEIDQPGTDTFRYRAGGAERVALAGRRRLALFANLGEELGLEDLLRYFEGFDLVLLEGYFGEAIPKIEVHRRETGSLLTSQDTTVLAIVSDGERRLGIPHFALGDVESLAFLVEAKLSELSGFALRPSSRWNSEKPVGSGGRP